MRISDWSSDVCSSDLPDGERRADADGGGGVKAARAFWLIVLVAGNFLATEAEACIPNSLEKIQKLSDVIVEGTFVIDSKVRGAGHIVPGRTLKGGSQTTHRVGCRTEKQK